VLAVTGFRDYARYCGSVRTPPSKRAWVFFVPMLTGSIWLAGATSVSASTIIGQVAPMSPPPISCTYGPVDLLQPTVTSGAAYVVPANGAEITSWSTNAAAGGGQTLEMKVYRTVDAQAGSYMAVAHDGPRGLTGGMLNTFPVSIPVQPGDLLGLDDAGASFLTPSACAFSAPGDFYLATSKDLKDGETGGPFISEEEERLNISAVIALKPSNDFSVGKLTRNEKRGTATLSVKVPGPGQISLGGGGVVRQTLTTATVSAAGAFNLMVKAKGKKRKRLIKSGASRLMVTVTYTPDGTATGDLVGEPSTKPKSLKLLKKR
jgi:hypothetical protein